MTFRRYQYYMDIYGVSRSMLVKIAKEHPELTGRLGRIPLLDEDGFIRLISNGTEKKQKSVQMA